MTTERQLISVDGCPCDGCKAKPCGHPARCVKFTLWLNRTADAVEVVRCFDCQKHEPCEVRNRVWCRQMGRYMKEDGFCSEGKVKEDG